MALDLLWLLIPVLGGVVVIALIATMVVICKQRCTNSDKDVESNNSELAGDTSEPDTGRPQDAMPESLRSNGASQASSRKLPSIPPPEEEGDLPSSPTPPPPPDVVANSERLDDAPIQNDDAGTYAAIGDQCRDGEISRPEEGRGIVLAPPPPDVAGKQEADEETGEPVASVSDRTPVYSFINRARREKSKKSQKPKEKEGIFVPGTWFDSGD